MLNETTHWQKLLDLIPPCFSLGQLLCQPPTLHECVLLYHTQQCQNLSMSTVSSTTCRAAPNSGTLLKTDLQPSAASTTLPVQARCINARVRATHSSCEAGTCCESLLLFYCHHGWCQCALAFMLVTCIDTPSLTSITSVFRVKPKTGRGLFMKVINGFTL